MRRSLDADFFRVNHPGAIALSETSPSSGSNIHWFRSNHTASTYPKYSSGFIRPPGTVALKSSVVRSDSMRATGPSRSVRNFSINGVISSTRPWDCATRTSGLGRLLETNSGTSGAPECWTQCRPHDLWPTRQTGAIVESTTMTDRPGRQENSVGVVTAALAVGRSYHLNIDDRACSGHG